LALGTAGLRLSQEHALFGLTIVLKNSDFDEHYIGTDRKLRNRTDADSKYGVCAHVFLAEMIRLLELCAFKQGPSRYRRRTQKQRRDPGYPSRLA
jgi:hypothetical protein